MVTIIDCLFYASDSLSGDVSFYYIAKLIVAWLYLEPEQKMEEKILVSSSSSGSFEGNRFM